MRFSPVAELKKNDAVIKSLKADHSGLLPSVLQNLALTDFHFTHPVFTLGKEFPDRREKGKRKNSSKKQLVSGLPLFLT